LHLLQATFENEDCFLSIHIPKQIPSHFLERKLYPFYIYIPKQISSHSLQPTSKNENRNEKFFLSISFFLFYSYNNLTSYGTKLHPNFTVFLTPAVRQQSRQQITNERLKLFYLLNGDFCYSIQTWPTNIQQLFWKKPTGDNDYFKLMLFFIGNGCSPEVIAKWILTS